MALRDFPNEFFETALGIAGQPIANFLQSVVPETMLLEAQKQAPTETGRAKQETASFLPSAAAPADFSALPAEPLQSFRNIVESFANLAPLSAPMETGGMGFGAPMETRGMGSNIPFETGSFQQEPLNTGRGPGGSMDTSYMSSFDQAIQMGRGESAARAERQNAGARQAAGGSPGRPVGTYSGPANPNASPQEIEAYIRQAAAARNINPDVAMQVVMAEGGLEPAKPGDPKRGGSYGPFQLNYLPGSLGSQFTATTGLHASDPSAWAAGVDFALDAAARGGWGPWFGGARVGVTGFMGIGTGNSQAPIAAQDPAKSGNLLASAQTQIGKPYMMGGGRGGDTSTFDCSSFVTWAYAQIGVNLPAFTDAQANSTQLVGTGQDGLSKAQPGDLIFYKYNDPTQNVTYPHVAIYMGEGRTIEARYGQGVMIGQLMNLPYEIRRVPQATPGVQ